MVKNPFHYQGVCDLGDQAALSTTAGTDPRFDAEDLVEKVGPRVVGGEFPSFLGNWL